MKILTDVTETLKSVFFVDADEINDKTQVVKRVRKFSPRTLAQTFLFAFMKKPTATFENIASMATEVGVNISPQAIEQRFTPALAEFFKAMFQSMTKHLVKSTESLAPILERFTEVILIDSSTVTLPETQVEEYRGCGGSLGTAQSALKLQTELDLKSGALRCVQIEEGKSPDQATDRQQVMPAAGALRIADLGYFSLPVLNAICLAEAFYLTRIQHNIKLFVEDIQTHQKVKHGLVSWLNSQNLGVVDCWIELGAQERLSCRLIAFRVPEEIANRRRQKRIADGKRFRYPSQASLAACDWEFMATNLPEASFSVNEVIVLYRARWQIELLFKRWKSQGMIAQMQSKSDLVKMIKFWIRLCVSLLQHWLSVCAVWSSSLSLRLAKVFEEVRDDAREIARNLSNNGDVISVLKSFCQATQRSCKRNKKKKTPGTLELLRNPDSLDYILT